MNNIETTICISYEHLSLIKLYAKEYKMPLHLFIMGLIRYMVSIKKIPVKGYTRLSYCARYTGKWKRFHLFLMEQEYEFLLDVKKICKMSVA